jgi:hypothetical protein
VALATASGSSTSELRVTHLEMTDSSVLPLLLLSMSYPKVLRVST